MEDPVSFGFAILVGFALSASCGMRIFAPLAILSAATYFGWVNPGSGFSWIGSMPALVCFSCACVIEILGMMIPWLDHVLDVAGTPIAAVAGTVVMASQLAGAVGVDTSVVPPWATWALAAVVGGGVAAGVHVATGSLRVGSTAVGAGFLNPIFALFETVMSFVLAGLAVLLPIVAVIVAIVLVISLVAIAMAVVRWRNRRGVAKAAVSTVGAV